jgi:vancomycin permeability regulator SanA
MSAANESTKRDSVWISPGRKTNPSRAIWFCRCCAMVAVGVSSRTPESRRRKASRKRSRMREGLARPGRAG